MKKKILLNNFLIWLEEEKKLEICFYDNSGGTFSCGYKPISTSLINKLIDEYTNN